MFSPLDVLLMGRILFLEEKVRFVTNDHDGKFIKSPKRYG